MDRCLSESLLSTLLFLDPKYLNYGRLGYEKAMVGEEVLVLGQIERAGGWGTGIRVDKVHVSARGKDDHKRLRMVVSFLFSFKLAHLLPVAPHQPRRGKALIEPKLCLLLPRDGYCVLIPVEPRAKGRRPDAYE